MKKSNFEKKHEKLIKSLGKSKLHPNRVPREKKEEVEKLPLYKTSRQRDLNKKITK
jgi:hypothetical protein